MLKTILAADQSSSSTATQPGGGTTPWPSRPRSGTARGPRTQHSFGGSFSAGSKPIFASKYAFFSIFQNLQENHLLASKFGKFLPKNWKILQNFWHFLANFAKFCKIFRNPQNFCKILQNFLQNFTEMCRFWKMLKNAILDAKICENFAKIWRNFDKILTKFWQRTRNNAGEWQPAVPTRGA